MTQAELKTVLDSSGIPFAYRAWKNGHDLPFGVFYFERDNPFAADGIVYAKKTLYALEPVSYTHLDVYKRQKLALFQMQALSTKVYNLFIMLAR